MKNNYYILFIVILVVLVGFVFSQASTTSEKGDGVVATIYMSPSCGCCNVYASYMSREGYKVNSENIIDMTEIKERFSVPYELGSCHTTELEGYVVEGHVPNKAIQKLLTEKPDIKGIGMAGMPQGSPGMPGPKRGDFVIYEITHEGARGDVFIVL